MRGRARRRRQHLLPPAAPSTSPTFFTLITSDRGDVVCLCDAAGDPFAAYRYDAWGLPQGAGTYATGIWAQSTALINATLAGDIASRQVLRYASYAWDAESALYYCSARFYDPATRQWTTGDPAKADGEESAYQYCGGEPVGGRDPTGLHEAMSATKVRGTDGPVKLKVRVEWNQTDVDGKSALNGVQFTRVKITATKLKRPTRLKEVGMEFGMWVLGHCNHNGGSYHDNVHGHEGAFHVPNPISGIKYTFIPDDDGKCWNHYNVLQGGTNWDLTVTGYVVYSRKGQVTNLRLHLDVP